MTILVLVLMLMVSGVGAVSNVETKYSSAIVFVITLACTTALIITGHIEM